MQEIPFSRTDWQLVCDQTLAIVNASRVEDWALHASLVIELQYLLEDLRQKYGEHPVLLETEAGYLDDPILQRAKYQTAIELAVANKLATITIRMSYARLLIDEFDDIRQARKELQACNAEMLYSDDNDHKEEWAELMGRCVESSRINGL